MKKLLLLPLVVFLFVSGCSSSGANAIIISLSSTTTTVQAGGTAQFTATVTNDPATKGVTWSVSCSLGQCGSVSPVSAASGAPTTYTAPAPASDLTVTITAASAADTTKTASVTIMVPAVTVSLAPPSANVAVSGFTVFTGTVGHDGANKGVIWTLVQGGARCAPATCGTIDAATPSGAESTYTAPASMPTNPNVTVTATSVTDPSKSASTTVTIMPVSVSVSPATASVVVNGTQQFTATVNFDAHNLGVTWTITLGGTPCPLGCGSVSPSSSLSGVAVTYTAPSSVPGGSVTLTATSNTDPTKSASATITVTAALPISVAFSMVPPSSIAVGTIANVAATVTNDLANKGVDWTVACASAGACGSFNPAHTASGVQTVYTAPANVPRLNTVTIIATSTADPAMSRSAILTITTVSPIRVAITMALPVGLVVSGTANVAATVTNDGTNKGVDWTVTCASAGACGSFNPAHAASSATTIYAAPASVPAGNTVTITATSTADPTKSASATITILNTAAACGSGNEGILNGQYAFLLQDFDSSGAVVIAGSFDADGRGHLATLVGVEDINRISGPQTNLTINAAGSSYSVGSDNRGCLTLLTSAGTTTFRFALGTISGGIASRGRMIEFDDTTGTGTRVAGQIRLQNPASFSDAQFVGNYAFGMYGQDSAGGRFAIAGTITSSGGGTITTGNFDADDAGTLNSNVPVTSGTYSIGSNGRGTLALLTGTTTLHFALYMISNSDAFSVSTDALSNATPIDSGEALGSLSSFSNSSLSGSLVAHSTGGNSGVSLVLASADGAGNLPTIDILQNNAGIFSTTTGSGTYAIASNGRVTLSGSGVGTHPPVVYLSGQNQGFLVGTGGSAETGMLEPQAAGTPSGAYFFGTETPATRAVTQQSGVAMLNAGNGSETDDSSGPSGLTAGSTSAFTYSFTSNGTGNVGSNTTAILVSGNKLVFFDNTSTSPKILVLEK